MKIVIKLSLNQFVTLHSLFEKIEPSETRHLGRETRVRRYILEKPIKQVQKKMIDVKNELNLFNAKTKIKISLEYYEAHYLEKWLEILDNLSTKDDINTWNVIKALRAELNARLA